MKNGAGGGGGGGCARAHFPEQRLVIEPSPYVATTLSAFGSLSTSAFFEARCKKKPAVSYFSTHRSLILNWIICHRGRMHCNKINNGLFHDVVIQVVDRDVSTAFC